MNCPNCGSSNQEERFCSLCGYSLQQIQQQKQTNSDDDTKYKSNEVNTENKKKNRPFYKKIGFYVTVFIFLILINFVLRSTVMPSYELNVGTHVVEDSVDLEVEGENFLPYEEFYVWIRSTAPFGNKTLEIVSEKKDGNGYVIVSRDEILIHPDYEIVQQSYFLSQPGIYQISAIIDGKTVAKKEIVVN